MKNLYMYYDTVSGNFSDVFEAENDLVMRRSALRALASVSPEVARDTVVLHVASIEKDGNGFVLVQPCAPIRTALSGSCPEVEQTRSELMLEAQRFSLLRGESDEE